MSGGGRGGGGGGGAAMSGGGRGGGGGAAMSGGGRGGGGGAAFSGGGKGGGGPAPSFSAPSGRSAVIQDRWVARKLQGWLRRGRWLLPRQARAPTPGAQVCFGAFLWLLRRLRRLLRLLSQLLRRLLSSEARAHRTRVAIAAFMCATIRISRGALGLLGWRTKRKLKQSSDQNTSLKSERRRKAVFLFAQDVFLNVRFRG